MRLVFDKVDAHYMCKNCDTPTYMSSIGATGYTMKTVEFYASQKCARCKQKLDVIRITGIFMKKRKHAHVR